MCKIYNYIIFHPYLWHKLKKHVLLVFIITFISLNFKT